MRGEFDNRKSREVVNKAGDDLMAHRNEYNGNWHGRRGIIVYRCPLFSESMAYVSGSKRIESYYLAVGHQRYSGKRSKGSIPP